MLEKMFTTKMSASKKQLQNRFTKIRSKSGITSKVVSGLLFGILIVVIISTSVVIAINSFNANKVNSLFKLKQTDFNDIENIEKIVEFSNFTPYEFNSIEIVNNGYENRIAVKFFVHDRSMHRITDDTACRKLSAVLLALVPDAEAVSCLIFDSYSEDLNNWESSFYSTYASKKDLSTNPLFGEINEEYINNSTKSQESFKEFYDLVSQITYKRELSDYLEKQYAFIGNDYEIGINSTIGADFLVDEEFLSSSECDEINKLFEIDIKEYKGFAICLRKTDIINFKTKERKKYISLNYYEGEEAVFISQKIIEIGEKSDRVKFLIQRLMSKTGGIVITNAENMNYVEIRALQYQVNNGHFPWRTDPVQVIKMFLTAQGEEVNNIRTGEITGDTFKLIYGDIEIEVFKPIDKSEQGIWIVKSYEKFKPATIENVVFFGQEGEIKKQPDGWYKLPAEINAFIYGEGTLPQSVTAYFTPTGTNAEVYKKQVGYAQAPFNQIPITVSLAFSDEDSIGHLQFVFNYDNREAVESELFNIFAA